MAKNRKLREVGAEGLLLSRDGSVLIAVAESVTAFAGSSLSLEIPLADDG